MKPLDLLHIPLEGTHLIEASAGTGKTYTIASLYVRLLLETSLRVREILVVTYTEAATDELKERIRAKVRDALKCFTSGTGDDPFLLELMKACRNRGHAVQRLEYALRRSDESSIFTIHGFCQRVLSELAFESRSLFDHELITDQIELVRECLGDFYRGHFTDSMPRELAHYAFRKGYTFGFFLRVFLQASLDIRIIPEMDIPDLSAPLSSYRESFSELKSCWGDACRDVERLLMSDPGLKRNIYRPEGIPRMLDEMNSYVSSAGDALPPFEGFKKFTSSALRNSVKKGFAPLEHEFFALCERHRETCSELSARMDSYLVWLKVQMFRHMRRELPRKKDVLGVVHFDDLLLKVRDSLVSENGAVLKENLSERYRAALIDEFQDTDPIQYQIFSTVFSDSPIFLIGDPKQAIYSFRGADVFTYLTASREVGEGARHTLEKNWRSEPELVNAVNSLFSRTRPFVFEGIPFIPVLPGEIPSRETLSDPNAAPLTIWYASGDSSADLNRREAEWKISRAVACEISRLLRAGERGDATLGSRPPAPKDMAVIVRENSQGRLVRDVLSSCGIPCVISSEENIFDTDEAREMEFLLRAVIQPYSESLIRTALSGELFGMNASEIDLLEKDDHRLEMWVERFRQYHELWLRSGFMRMFRRLMADEDSGARLLRQSRGERMLTNYLHLAEVLNRVYLEKKLGMRGLLKWLSRQRDPSMPRSEEYQLRLESDDDAVKIMTVHKSKGLEFPIVFCPFLWGPSELRDKDNISFHDREQGLRAFLDLGSDRLGEHRILAERELLAENMRLVYVALTRARNRCYLVWGRFRKGGSSALSYLFHTQDEGGDASGRESGAPSRPAGSAPREDLERVCSGQKGRILVQDLSRQAPERYLRAGIEAQRLSCREFSGRIDRSWRVSSFSSMISDMSRSEQGVIDRDDLYPSYSPGNGGDGEGGGEGVFRLPGGARTGIMLHSVFEHLDFQADEPSVRALAARTLQAHGFEGSWGDAVVDMVQKALAIPVNGLPLSSVRNDCTVRELEFYLPVKRISRRLLKEIFRSYGRDTIPDCFPDMMEGLRFDETTGFLRGFIDLVFTAGGKYYLLDWKSNNLGPGVEHYGQDALEDAMAKNYYILQYHLYAAALHAYLKKRLKGYDYQRDFGGVIYVFLRGIDPLSGQSYGVYRRMPGEEIVRALGEGLAP